MTISRRQNMNNVRQNTVDDIEVRLARIGERTDGFQQDFTTFVGNVNATFTEFRASLNALNTKLEDRGRAPWQLILGFGVFLLGIIGGLGTLVYAPIKDTELRLETAVARVAEGAVTEKEFSTYEINSSERRDFNNKTVTDRADRIGTFVTDLNKSKVEKDVYAADANAEATKDAAMQREIDEVRSSVSGIYNPRDALTRLEKRNDELEQAINTLTAKLATVVK